MNAAFATQILSEKLSKLNDSQQSIETLSHWCIFHRKNAKQVVEIWEREFFASPRERRVPFLFLANDILQNSRRKGGEFVNEFWKVLPIALKEVLGSCEENVRATIFRLVEIWEERKVFGSRAQSLREELVGHDTLSTYENRDKLARMSTKMVRKNLSYKQCMKFKHFTFTHSHFLFVFCMSFRERKVVWKRLQLPTKLCKKIWMKRS
ncbi:hypothetical protein O6H91_Y273000 [Diphasiastrum complanatum]|nr:hypothetical protein O6H91_Y273000 [Diphasiastrum complanatum]